MDSKAEIERAERFLERLAKRALSLEGTCTGEHGVGQGKMKYLLEELGEPALAVMRSLKRAIDPHNIMNPGKLA
jgi:D-lactate dehydrogenase (cytochrome)